MLSGPDYRVVSRSGTTAEGLGPIVARVPAEWGDVGASAWVDADGAALGPAGSRRRTRCASLATSTSRACSSPRPRRLRSRSARALAELDRATRCTRGESSAYDDGVDVGIAESRSDCGARDDEARNQIWDCFIVD
ncbi:MAG TPA: hypothetical protein VMG12_44600 [Polyangiaceae bacterium]|nr:hypothetical protein [Polyangiaceae bacterium]